MQIETLTLRPENPDVTLTSYIADEAPELNFALRPAVIVCPGGGYSHLSPREAEPVAMQFFAAGFQSFVLRYSVGEHAQFPNALLDASMAVTYVRRHAPQHHIDPHRIFLLGFSAGGHLAATLGTMYHTPHAAFPGMEPGENRPDGLILCYAPTTARTDAVTNAFCQRLVLTKEEMEACSPEAQVHPTMPPAYIWHCASDSVVPVEHAIRIAMAMAKAKVPHEMHIFPGGTHGMALATVQTSGGRADLVDDIAAQWCGEAIDWAQRLEVQG